MLRLLVLGVVLVLLGYECQIVVCEERFGPGWHPLWGSAALICAGPDGELRGL